MKTLMLAGFVLLVACGPQVPATNPITVKTIDVKRAAPIVPRVDSIQQNDVNWVVITEDNVGEVFATMRATGQEPSLYAVDGKNYRNVLLNQSNVITVLRQQQRVIAVYRRSYE